MSSAREVLSELWGGGVRVSVINDKFRLDPPGTASEHLKDQLRSNRTGILAVLGQLPAPGLCPICGSPNGWGEIDGNTTAHCVGCATIAAQRAIAVIDTSRSTTKGATGAA